MNKLVVGLVVGAWCFAMQAVPTTFYVAPDGADDSDCTSWETAGSLSNAIAKVKAWADSWVDWNWNLVNKATSWDNPNRVVLRRGTYDLSSFSGGSFADLNGNNYSYLVIESEDNDPAGTLLVGGGTNANARCFRMADNVQQRLVGLCITNWGHDWVASPSVQGAGVYGGGSVIVSNCIVTCCQSGIGGGIAGWSNYGPGPSVYDSIVSQCYAKEGGGIFASGRIVRSVICHNSSPKGSAIGGRNTTTSVFDSQIVSNTGSFASCHTYTVNCSNCVFAANQGGVFNITQTGREPTITDCRFIDNYRNGGGVVFYAGVGSAIQCKGCMFKDNVSNSSGGGIICGSTNFDQSSVFTNCVFDGNVVSNSASCGSACILGAGKGTTKVKCYDCVFRNNKVTRPTSKWEQDYGAVVRSTVLYNCVFSNNWCYSVGAVGNSILTRCTLVGNGADYCAAADSCTMTNCLIVANTCPTKKTVYTDNQKQFGTLRACTLVNCTVADNSNHVEGVIGALSSSCAARNCIFVNNVPLDIGALQADYIEANYTFYNCAYGTKHDKSVTAKRIKGENLWQTNETNKMRFDAANPWHLKRRSFGIDIGCDVGWTADDVDLSGAPRLNGIVDLGCYEYWPKLSGLMLLLR